MHALVNEKKRGWQVRSKSFKTFFYSACVCFFCFVFSPFVRTLALAAEWKQEALSHLGWLSSHHQVGSFSHLGPFIGHRQSFLHPKLYFEASSRKFKIAELGGKNKSFVQHVQFELCEEALLLPFHCPLLWRNHFFFFLNEVRRTLSQKAVHSWVSWTDGRLKHTTKGLLWCCQFSFMKSFWYKLEKALCSVKDFFSARCLCQGQCFYYRGEVYTPPGGWQHIFFSRKAHGSQKPVS